MIQTPVTSRVLSRVRDHSEALWLTRLVRLTQLEFLSGQCPHEPGVVSELTCFREAKAGGQ
ncbi:hypothetical protein GCM10027217_38580 [Pseudomaricurvus hydrocarbonicus]